MSHWATRLRLVAGIVGLSLFAAAGQLHALSGGPTVPRSGAPGESNCASCHHGAENANGSVAVSFSGGNTYTPGVWKRVTITITPNPTTSAQVKYGFQASARAGGSRAGTFGIINDNSQFMAVKCAANASASLTDRPAGGSCGATGYEYIQHNQPYGGGGGLATYTVSFLWQPPASNVGNVTFYATSVLGVSPYPTPTYAFGTSKTLTFQGPGTAPDPVYPAGSLGLEALDTPSNQIVATRIVTANPLWKTAMKRDGSRVYALTLRGNQLLTIDPRNGALLNIISVLGTALALSPDESRLYVVGQLNVSTARLYVFDAGTGAPIGSPLDFASAAYYFAVAATPDGRRIYIVPWLSSPTVVVIDAATRTQLASITTSALPRALAVSPDSSRLLVATVDGTTSASALTIFSTATGAALAPPIQLDPVARGVVFSPDGASAYVLTEDGTNFVRITTIDVATANPVAQFSFPSLGNSNFFRISPDGAYFYGGGNVNPGGEPNVYAWSVALAGTPVAIPSAQGVLDIAVRPPPPVNLPPTVTTLAATSITTTGATLNGTVNPNGTTTTAEFNYGLTTGYGSTVAASPPPGSGVTQVSVSAAVAGLTCGTAYHYRLAGTNAQGTSNGADRTFITGTFFGETFDAAVAPALPAGWTTSTLSGSTNAWVTSELTPDSVPNRAFASDLGTTSDSVLISPTIAIPAGASQVMFRHLYNVESAFDGGVLEIAIDGGTFQDIIAAGGSFVAGGYTGSLIGTNPIAGRQAWTGNSGTYVTTTVTLPASAAGHNAVLRWRMTSDASVPGSGWSVDTIALVSLACGPPSNVGSFVVSNPGTSNRLTLSWNNPASNFAGLVILRRPGTAVTDVPVTGVSYSAGQVLGNSTVVYAGSATSYADLGLVNGTAYHYRVFAHNGAREYASGVAGSGTPTASNCTYALAPTAVENFSKAGGSTAIVVTTPNGCPVTATSFQPWVTVGAITPSGSGTTSVQLGISANTGPARATSIVLAGRLFLVRQSAGP